MNGLNELGNAPHQGTRPTFERVLRWARQRGEEICVLEGNRVFTFAHLLEYAEANRRVLARARVAEGDLVAVSCSRRAPAIAGMLAAWSLGAAYLPLSSMLPKARAKLIMDVARPAALLADSEDPFAPAVCRVRDDAVRRLDPRAAYVLFTSGSTGTPKGVVLGHAGLDLLTRWHRDVTSLAAGECASQVADLNFDASVWEIWGALANGASIAVPSLDSLLDPPELQTFLLQQEVRAAFIPVGLISGLLDLSWPAEVPLRVLFTGGDRLTRWPEPRHPFRLINAYGPTECTVVATSHPLRSDDGGTRPPPIGRPLPHVHASVVGPDGVPVGPGETGELWLAGPAVALGYLGRWHPSDAFVSRDFGDGVKRWYRTGDLVVEERDGVLHYVSRMDDQVQIGGRRTEPAEIVQAILELPAVTDAVVFTRETTSGEVRLAAAVTPATVTRAEIHSHLKRLLPIFMIPTDILPMEALPLTGNGKFDISELRNALR